MSLFGTIGRIGLGTATGGLSELGRALNRPKGVPGPRGMQPLADPSLIKPEGSLVTALGGIGDRQQNNLSNIFSKARSTVASDNAVRGVAPGSPYEEGRLGQAETQANAGLRGGLENILGNTAYENFRGEQGFNQNAGLAHEIAALNKPTTLQEILGGLSGAANAGGNLYGALGGRGKSPMPASSQVSYGPYSGPQPGMMSFQDPYLEAYYNGR